MSFLENLIKEFSDGGEMGAIANFVPKSNGSAAVAPPKPPIPPISKPMKKKSSLSLSIKMEHGDFDVFGENLEGALVGRKEDDYGSRSGSDNIDGAVSGDEHDAGEDGPPRKKKYHRHTPNQIQELEAFFKECPHPDEKQRVALSSRLGLESKQIKFWFQNRRTQMKTQMERHENIILKQENEKLQAENDYLKHALRNNTSCTNCSGHAVIDEASFEDHHLRMENARLNDELNKLRAVAESSSVNSNLNLAMGINNGFNGVNNAAGPTLAMGLGFGDGPMMPMGLDMAFDRQTLISLALVAMDEFMRMAQFESPLWINGGKDTLNLEEYMRTFPPCIGLKPSGYVTEASRDAAMVMISSVALVDMMMDPERWAATFPFMIHRAETIGVVFPGVDGTKNNALLAIEAEMKVLSPMVPARKVKFIRFCKQHAEGVWAVVDVSIDIGRDSPSSSSIPNCRKLPSGCLIQDMGTGYSKVIWVEHSEYDESGIHNLFKPLVRSGLVFGSETWLSTLQKQCDRLAMLMSPIEDPTAISLAGRESVVKLAQRITFNFCLGISGSNLSTRKWEMLPFRNMANGIMVLHRRNVDEPGEPIGVMLSASTTLWLPVSQNALFEFLQNDQIRVEWDILSSGVPMLEIIRIPKGQEPGNYVSILRGNTNGSHSNVVVLQETWNSATGSFIVYAPVDEAAIELVTGGGDSSYVELLPSGFAIFPCTATGPATGGRANGPMITDVEGNHGGCLLTVGFQILANRVPSTVLTRDTVETVNTLISRTIRNIKTALNIAGAVGAAR